MSRHLYRNPRLLALVVFGILLAGGSSLLSLARQEDPTITNLYATVITPFPGADPARVEALVTTPVEEQLRAIAAVNLIESSSRAGLSLVSLELDETLDGAAIAQAWSEIRDALDDASRQFPAGAGRPQFDNQRGGAYTLIAALLPAPGQDPAPAVLQRYALALQERLRNVPGTRQVDLFGQRQEEILVTLDGRRLEAQGLTPDQVAAAIATADAKVSAGRIVGPATELLVEPGGEIRALARVREIPLQAGGDGRLVRVGDLAEVRRTLHQPAEQLALVDGTPAVLVAVRMEDGRQVDAWAARVRERLAAFAGQLPAGLQQRLLFDQSRYTLERLGEVTGNLLLGMGLVVLVLLITLGWRAALVVAAMLPLASLLSLTLLGFLGIPIHQMSVTGLIVALGLLVDAAIVVTDEIRRRLEDGETRARALTTASRRLALPLLASTLTTALAFTPMVLLPGPSGDFVGAIASAVIVMLGSSLVLALTLAPALAGRWLRVAGPGEPRRWWRHGVRLAPLARLFGRSLDLALAHPWLALLAALVLPVIGFGAFPTLTAQFFPGVDRDQFHVQLELSTGSAIDATARAVAQADRVLRNSAGVVAVQWVLGESAPAFYYNMKMDRDGSPGFAEALVTSASAAATADLIPVLQRQLDAQLPGARVVVRGLVQGPPVDAPVELRLVGPDLAVLRDLGERLRGLLAAQPGVVQTRAQLEGGAAKLVLDLDEARLAANGLSLSAAAGQLRQRLDGITGGSLLEGTEELPVRVRLAREQRSDPGVLRNLDLLAGSGESARRLPLASVASPRLVPAQAPIQRRNGERVNTVQAFIQRDRLPAEILDRVQARLAAGALPLPPGYRLETGGDADARDGVARHLLGSLGLIVALTVASLVLTFNSYRLAALTALVALLATGLSLLALALGDYPFGIQAMFGVLGSVGVSINAAIILLTALQADPAAAGGDPAAIARQVSAAGRHIVSTTVTTFGGFLPLLLAGGGFWPPFAAAIAGGVLLSTLVSFYFTPPAFRLLAARRTPVPAAAAPAPA
jgi:multidrug efflux pump subunit AcrB